MISIPATYFEEPDLDTLIFSSQLIVQNNLEKPLPHFIEFDSNTVQYTITPKYLSEEGNYTL